MNVHASQFVMDPTEQVNKTATMSQAMVGKIASMIEENFAYSRQVVDGTSALVQDLLGKRNTEEAMEIQTKFVRDQSTAFFDQCEKISKICQDLAEEAFMPARSAVASAKAMAA